MSIKIMSWVLDHSPYTGKQRLVHLVLADHANDEGLCWPSQATIARRAGCSVEYVRTTVTQMVAEGFLFIEKQSAGRGHPTHYRIIPKTVTPNPVGPFPGNPQIQRDKPPNPSPNNHQEPPVKPNGGEHTTRCLYCRDIIKAGEKYHYCSAMNQRVKVQHD
jgi:hypothetical protein